MPHYLTFNDFRRAEKANPYWAGRWPYLDAAIRVLREHAPIGQVLELGANGLPLVAEADTMDLNPDLPGLTYVHDVKQIPWPIAAKNYDTFIALQVWEHLEDQQQAAFREVVKISRRALLSFPFEWEFPASDDPHRMISSETIAQWTCSVKPVSRTMVHTPIKRLVLFFDFGSNHNAELQNGRRSKGPNNP